MTASIADRLKWDLTPENLVGYGLDPIILGEYVELRHQVVDDHGVAVSLAGAALVMSVRRGDSLSPSDLIFVRRSVDNIVSWSPTTPQLAADTDQTVEDVTAGTGTGWWTMTFAPPDEAVLILATGRWQYDVRAKFGDGKVLTLLRGKIAIQTPRTILSAFT